MVALRPGPEARLLLARVRVARPRPSAGDLGFPRVLRAAAAERMVPRLVKRPALMPLVRAVSLAHLLLGDRGACSAVHVGVRHAVVGALHGVWRVANVRSGRRITVAATVHRTAGAAGRTRPRRRRRLQRHRFLRGQRGVRRRSALRGGGGGLEVGREHRVGHLGVVDDWEVEQVQRDGVDRPPRRLRRDDAGDARRPAPLLHRCERVEDVRRQPRPAGLVDNLEVREGHGVDAATNELCVRVDGVAEPQHRPPPGVLLVELLNGLHRRFFEVPQRRLGPLVRVRPERMPLDRRLAQFQPGVHVLLDPLHLLHDDHPDGVVAVVCDDVAARLSRLARPCGRVFHHVAHEVRGVLHRRDSPPLPRCRVER
mmetsp:Transcript_52823/g.162625  ORF Transcript_52823/g.162625 Transcript_52823/m.162625 type:complete len:369 (-) Transcript_52823:163-1269(-)